VIPTTRKRDNLGNMAGAMMNELFTQGRRAELAWVSFIQIYIAAGPIC
jgi:hypothetical protein